MLTKNDTPLKAPPSVETRRTVFLKGLALQAEIGAYDHEVGVHQPIIIDLSLDVSVPENPASEELDDIVCYDRMSQDIRAILKKGHIKLVETLAERIAEMALANTMVKTVTVRIEKTTAVDGAAGAGVEITRERL
ncbi:MAG: dihydroneopterin aldolase [Pseudomonadota bacterium]